MKDNTPASIIKGIKRIDKMRIDKMDIAMGDRYLQRVCDGRISSIGKDIGKDIGNESGKDIGKDKSLLVACP
ncbi:hypothetical protein [Egbenema bharatensis]|uniref:hypothetical protein n=1 Tax=Egbenema bharatensis TaxID=3463334 RepID=UPI003A898EE9